MKKRLLAALLACVFCFALLPQAALAAETIHINSHNSSGNGWTFANGELTIKQNGTYTIDGTGTSASIPTDNRIVVQAGTTASITLKDVNINTDTGPALLLENGANVTLTLVGTSILKSTCDKSAGIQAPAGTTLTITSSSGGSLTAQGGNLGAGIGGGGADSNSPGGNGGTIIIQGNAEVTATGGKGGAGIGGGGGQAGGSITIQGSAVVEAMGGADGGGAGIGGGTGGNGGTIKIQGSAVVEAEGGNAGAGIGGGNKGAGGSITIQGSAVVEATGIGGGAGIGGGHQGTGGAITIRDEADVTAVGGSSIDGGGGAGIGDGCLTHWDYTNKDRTIRIGNPEAGRLRTTVKATGGIANAGIGFGQAVTGGGTNENEGGEITIYGNADVTAKGGDGYVPNDGQIGTGGGAGIGGGGGSAPGLDHADVPGRTGGTITIYPGANVTAKGGAGAGRSDNNKTFASGGGAGIGGGGGGVGGSGRTSGGAPGTLSLPMAWKNNFPSTITGGAGILVGTVRSGDGAQIGFGGDGANQQPGNMTDTDGASATDITYLTDPEREERVYEVRVTCLGPGESNIKAPREVEAGSILRVKLYPEEGAALLALTVNGQTYDPSLLKVEGEALIYGINRIDEDYELVAEFGEPFVVDVPEVEVTDPPKTGEAAASGGFFMLLALAVGIASMRRKMKNEE